MKLTAFLRDRFPAYLIDLIAWSLAVIFLGAFHCPVQASLIVSAVLLLAVIITEGWEFWRRNRYYSKLLRCLEELDQKYLISETVESPGFLEGEILSEVIREGDRSMCERIAAYRRESMEFREYIELWVHEIKLPVASLQLMCHNDEMARYAEPLRRIDSYIENVLYYARIGSAEKDYIIKEVSLRRVFSDTAVRHRKELQERGITLRTGQLDVQVMTDAKWLSYMLGQLMGNCIKYISPHRAPEISVTAETLPDRTILHVRDNGIGIPEHDLPYVFEKSFTGSNGRTRAKSTGMGLYIVRRLCEKMGHSVSAASVQDEFTEISIVFGRSNFMKP